MDLVIEDSGGPNIVAREMALPEWYAPATVDAREVEVFYQLLNDANELVGSPIPLGRFSSVAEVVIPHNPDLDCRVRVYLMPYGPDGTPGYSSLHDCPQLTVDFRREADAPVIGQNAPATMNEVEIGITNFTRFARMRRVTISEHADMSDPVAIIIRNTAAEVARELPRYFTLQREAGGFATESGDALTTEGGDLIITETGAGALPRTVYLTVAHSSGVAWTPESNALQVTFAAGDGTGGSPGDFDPTPRDNHNLDIL